MCAAMCAPMQEFPGIVAALGPGLHRTAPGDTRCCLSTHNVLPLCFF